MRARRCDRATRSRRATSWSALDARELLLQKEAALAESERHAADALKAESSGDVAGLRIARAREAQARAQREIVDERLARAEVKAPFDGVVVEGDLRERLAAPVQKGDGLLKIARIEDLYLVIEVSERDVQDIRGRRDRSCGLCEPAGTDVRFYGGKDRTGGAREGERRGFCRALPVSATRRRRGGVPA